MALTPPKAPTAPQAPVPPSVDIGNSVPESTVEASGPAVPAGELETPASKFGIHWLSGLSERLTPVGMGRNNDSYSSYSSDSSSDSSDYGGGSSGGGGSSDSW